MNEQEVNPKFETEVERAVDVFHRKSLYEKRAIEIIRRRVVDIFEIEVRENQGLLGQRLAGRADKETN